MAKKKTLATANDAVYRGVYSQFAPRETAATGTDMITRLLERVLLELSMNRFDWQGLPDEVSVRWLEMALARNSLSVFYFDRDYDRFFAQMGAGSGQLNMIGDPTEFIVYGNPFGAKTLKATDVVPIWGNYLRTPDWDLITIYARRLAELDRTIEINGKNARLPKVLQYPENSKLTVDNFLRQIDQGNPALKLGDQFSVNDVVQVLDLGVDPAQILNLSVLRGRIWNEAMTLLGINNANQDKKERLVAAEVSGNDDMVTAIRATNLQARQQACEQINRMWPSLNVTVQYVNEAEATEGDEAVEKDTMPQGAVGQGGD